MTPQAYIQQRLESLSTAANPGDTTGHIEDVIYARLMSKKFRKRKAGDVCIEITKRVVAKAVKDQTPIIVTECFGGSKLWRFEEAPEIDWAELFSLMYFVDWIKTVAAVHEPGVVFDYFSQDLAVERLDNITREELDAYNTTFTNMIAWIKPYLPKGVTINYRRHRDMFDDESKYDSELNKAMKQYLQEHDNTLPVLDDSMKARTELNVRLASGQGDDPLWREKVELQHQALFMTPTLGTYLNDPDLIWTCPSCSYSDSIITGSTKWSIAKFWAAIGALQHNGQSYAELVLTPKQLSSAQFTWEELHLSGLDSKNFSRIRILE